MVVSSAEASPKMPVDAPAIVPEIEKVRHLDQLFVTAINILAECRGFAGRKQLPAESFLECVTAFKVKAVQCRFGLTSAE